MSELKPCPFCGGDHISLCGDIIVNISCYKCGARISGEYLDVVNKWNTRTQSQWISVEDAEPESGKLYWHTHIKPDGSFTKVWIGTYQKAFKKMETGNFTHYMECTKPLPPKAP